MRANPPRFQDHSLPVAVIGAGPVGLAAAAHLAARGVDFVVLERGAGPGTSVAEWGHVRMFSPWKYDLDPVAVELLEADGWRPPDPEAYPTGRELRDRFLVPLAASPRIAPGLRFGTEVLGVSRLGADRQSSRGRETRPLILRLRTAGGEERDLAARALIDASGTWTQPKPLGAHGLPALGEAACAERIAYGIPDLAGRDRERYAGRTVAVVGGGDSAFNVLADLAALDAGAPGSRIHWILRGEAIGFGGGAADQLPARGALGGAVRELVDRGRIEVDTGFGIRRVGIRDGAVRLESDRQVLAGIDEVVCVTGFRPDHGLLRELRLELDPITEAPTALGPLIDPNVHSCGTVPPHGYRELRHPEPDVYVVGMKSYGRAPTFLLLTGYEQVRSVVAAIAGDVAAAREVELALPETGVCSSDLVPAPLAALAGASACGTAGAACGADRAASAASAAVHEGEVPGYAYGRIATPTQSALERCLAELERRGRRRPAPAVGGDRGRGRRRGRSRAGSGGGLR